MAFNAKSMAASSALGDVFAKLRWQRYGVIALPVDTPTEVAVQYKSEALGCVRIVLCDSAGLARWLHQNAVTPGVWVRFSDILDKKDEYIKAIQEELPLELPRMARHSMIPD